MKFDPFKLEKQSGKVVKPVIIASGISSAIAILKDTDFYQVSGNLDYVQDNGSK